MKTKRIGVDIDPEDFKRLKAILALNELKLSDWIRKLVKEKIKESLGE